jgi:hypothetical protein
VKRDLQSILDFVLAAVTLMAIAALMLGFMHFWGWRIS